MRDLLSALRTIVGERHVLADADLRAGYETDWTGRWHGQSLAVVRPADADEVAAVLRACAVHHVAVVTQGGNTGLVGGATPAGRGAEIVLSMRRLDSIGDADPALMQLPCGAGVTLARLQRAAADAGLQAGLDLAARDSATVGGLAACNAGGLQAVRYGTARRRVAGLEAVLADGAVVSRMSGLRKDNAGYDLPSLLIGSEGTLGVITRVLWSMVPRFSDRALALVAVGSAGEAVAAARALLARLPSLELLELVDEQSVRISLAHLSAAPPAPITPAWVLVGCASSGDAQEELAEALVESGLDEHAVVAVDARRRQRLLSIRESTTDAIAAAGVPHKLDVGVPLAELESFLNELPAVVAATAPGARTFVYGHLGDGNLHVNLLGPAPDDESADRAVLELAARCGGTITAEHGVGRHKPGYLALVRSDAEIAAMRAIKRALDPEGILNPGVILA
ncbi:MAG: FAD-binding oxidoreductase [Solirubrobacteraceae bacterium]